MRLPSRHGSALALAALGAALTLVASCNRLNPDWCETYAPCGTNETCDPATNTCRPRDLGPPDGPPDLRPDLPLDLAPDHPVVDLVPQPDRAIDQGHDLTTLEAAPAEGGSD